MAHYFPLDSATFEAFLQTMGFARNTSNTEVVYERTNEKEPGLKIKVYTSSSDGASSARDVGKDAVRIVAFFQGKDKSYGIFKGSRVYRTTSQESIQERVAQRIVEAQARCEEWLAEMAEKRNAPLATTKPPAQLPLIPVVGEHFGNLRDNVRLELTVTERKPWSGKFLFVFKDNAERVFNYWSQKDLLQVGETYDLAGFIKCHGSFRGVKFTELGDVKGKRISQ